MGSTVRSRRRSATSWRRLWVRGRRLPFDPWKAALAVLLAGAVVAVLGWVLLGSRLLVVRQVQVAGQQAVPRAEIVETAAVPLGAPLIQVEPGAVARRVAGIRQVESARVERRWPSTLHIAVTERRPIAAEPAGSGYRLLDRFGVVVATVGQRPRGMPLVELADGGKGPAARAALAVVDALPDNLEKRTSKVTASDPTDVTLHLADGATVVWGGPERSADKARTLIVLLRRDADVYDVSSPEVATTR